MNYLPSSRFVALTTTIAGLPASRFAQTENRLDKVKLSIKKIPLNEANFGPAKTNFCIDM